MLRVKLLGQFQLRPDDQPVGIRFRPAQSLLASLMLHAGTAQRSLEEVRDLG
jgi:DNA-binding SARP family transcriptional activator